jgi:hypothetical protein
MLTYFGEVMRGIITMCALWLVVSATEVAAACNPDLSGTWNYSALRTLTSSDGIVQVVLGQNCVLTIVGATITSVALCTGDAGGANGDAVSLTNQQITIAADCSFQIIGADCQYRGQFNGDIGAGVAGCGFNRIMFDLIKQ